TPHHRRESFVLERPGSGRARPPRAEVAAGGQDRVRRQVPAGLLGPVVEEELAEAGPLDALEELLRDDLVRVDVAAVEHRDGALDDSDRVHSHPLMSTKCPSMAAAAAIFG